MQLEHFEVLGPRGRDIFTYYFGDQIFFGEGTTIWLHQW
jgi:hypothetical protein